MTDISPVRNQFDEAWLQARMENSPRCPDPGLGAAQIRLTLDAFEPDRLSAQGRDVLMSTVDLLSRSGHLDLNDAEAVADLTLLGRVPGSRAGDDDPARAQTIFGGMLNFVVDKVVQASKDWLFADAGQAMLDTCEPGPGRQQVSQALAGADLSRLDPQERSLVLRELGWAALEGRIDPVRSNALRELFASVQGTALPQDGAWSWGRDNSVPQSAVPAGPVDASGPVAVLGPSHPNGPVAPAPAPSSGSDPMRDSAYYRNHPDYDRLPDGSFSERYRPAQDGAISVLSLYTMDDGTRVWRVPPRAGADSGPAAVLGPSKPEGPVAVLGPSRPEGPVAVLGPSKPEGPVAVLGPSRPEGPVAVLGPSRPEGPVAVLGPSRPEGPVAVLGPSKPEGPVAVLGPSRPEGPVAVLGPSNPDGPVAAAPAPSSGRPDPMRDSSYYRNHPDYEQLPDGSFTERYRPAEHGAVSVLSLYTMDDGTRVWRVPPTAGQGR